MVALACIWLIIPYAGPDSASTDDHDTRDRWSEKVASLRSLDAVQQALPAFIIKTGNDRRDTALAITKLLELHFVHGVARESWRTNWIANVLDWMAPEGFSFSGMMDPDEILTQRVAFCSQMSLVANALFRRNGIPYATVEFNHGGKAPHSAVAANPDGVWRFYDASYEPTVQGFPLSQIIAGHGFSHLYSTSIGSSAGRSFEHLAKLGKVRLIDLNGGPPPRGPKVQWLTRNLSTWGWVGLLALAVFLWCTPRIHRHLWTRLEYS